MLIYCLNCQEKKEIVGEASIVILSNKFRMAEGICSGCNRTITQLVPKGALMADWDTLLWDRFERRNDRIALMGPFGAGKTEISKAWANVTRGVQFEFSDHGKVEYARALAINEIMNDYENGQQDVTVQTLFHNFLKRSVELNAEMNDREKKENHRIGMQQWMTDIRRDQDEDYWSSLGEKRIQKMERELGIASTPPIAVVLRYPNEHSMLLRHGFTIIRLRSKHAIDPNEKRNQHDSEKYWPTLPADIELSYIESSPEAQARRLIEEYGLGYASGVGV